MTGKRKNAERARQQGGAGRGRGRGRGRRALGLIGDRRARLDAFGKRKETLMTKALHLSILCGVEIAVVVAPADGDGGGEGAAADVWESTEGAVLARYRALDPETRARHTHRAYLEGGLGKEEAKLARVRQAGPTGLDPWDKALDGIATAEEAQRLLEAIDAAIRATEDRMTALGLPVDGAEDDDIGAGVVLEGIAPLAFAGADGYPLHAAPGCGGDTTYGNQAMWGNDGFQRFTTTGAGMEGYNLEIAPDMYAGGGSNSNNGGGVATDAYLYQPREAGTMQHGYGFHQCAGTGYYDMPAAAGHRMQELLGWGTAHAQPNLAMWSTEEPPRHAMVPVNYPSRETDISYMDMLAEIGAQGGGVGGGGLSFAMGGGCNFVNAPPPELSLAMGTAGCDFIDAPPLAFAHATGGTGTDTTPAQPLAMSYDGADMAIAGRYATQWQAPQQQPQRAGSGQQQSGVEQMHYLSDIEDAQSSQAAAQKHQDAAGNGGPQSGIELLHYLRKLEEDDTQLHLWGN